MHHIRATGDGRWISFIGIAGGLAVFTVGLTAHGHAGADLRQCGMVMFLAASGERSIRSAYVLGHRAGYRRGRRVARPVSLAVPRQEERAQAVQR
jgi:hypothetical protein